MPPLPGADSAPQGFDRLLPLASAEKLLLDATRPVAATRRPLEAALGFASAADLCATRREPDAPVAARDGYAVSSRETIGATPAAPVYASGPLSAVWAGERMPEGCDAVLPPEAMIAGGGGAEILQAVAPAAGTRASGHDFAAGGVLVRAGERLRADRLAVLAMAGVTDVAVRIPSLGVEGNGPTGRLVEALAAAEGAAVTKAAEADLVLIPTNPGHAATAAAARATMAGGGTLLAHGLAVQLGLAIGFGTLPRADSGARLFFIVPERLEEVMAAWLLLIRPSLAAMAGRRLAAPLQILPLTRKIVSPPGLAELVLLRRAAAAWEPIATGDLPWSAFARAEAYALIPAESEGMAAGGLLPASSL